jgi:hypothetical protein
MNKPIYISFKQNTDLRGCLTAIDSENILPFDIKRIFYISNLDDIERGYHAHRKCEQILIPICGCFNLVLDDGIEETHFVLNQSHIGVYIPLFHWLKMKNFSKDCIILVICSYKYDETEYIRDYNEFINEVNKMR